MAMLLVRIRRGEIVRAAASDEMYRLMTNIYYDDYTLSEIPPYVETASKLGMVNASRSELVMVNAPGGDCVFFIWPPRTMKTNDGNMTMSSGLWPERFVFSLAIF